MRMFLEGLLAGGPVPVSDQRIRTKAIELAVDQATLQRLYTEVSRG